MSLIKSKKGVIAILTGGGDVPGFNPAIRATTIRAIDEGYTVVGLLRGWSGISHRWVRDAKPITVIVTKSLPRKRSIEPAARCTFFYIPRAPIRAK